MSTFTRVDNSAVSCWPWVTGPRKRQLLDQRHRWKALRSGIAPGEKSRPWLTIRPATANQTFYAGASAASADGSSGIDVDTEQHFLDRLHDQGHRRDGPQCDWSSEEECSSMNRPRNICRTWERPALHGYDLRQGKPNLRPPVKPVTLRHLLTHTSGFAYGHLEPGRCSSTAAARPGTRCRPVQVAPLTPLVFEPGTRWQYGYKQVCRLGWKAGGGGQRPESRAVHAGAHPCSRWV